MSTLRTHTAPQAIERLRELVHSGDFNNLLPVDRQSGELLSAEAKAIFAALPVITPASSPEELVDHGIIAKVPKELRRVMELPRYTQHRPLFVRTTVGHGTASAHKAAGAFDAKGAEGFTHLAQLLSQSTDNFLVRVDGNKEPLLFAKPNVFAWNEPATLPAQGAQLSGVQIDYQDPLLRAHIHAGLIDIAHELSDLDFADAKLQKKLIHKVASRVQMLYPGRSEGYAGAKAGALIHGGLGVCFVQRAVAAALLQPFARLLAFDIQVAIGQTLRLNVPHGFLVLTLKPSLERYVVDPAWGEPLTDLRVAFFDAGWGHDRRLVGFEGQQELRVRPEAIDLPFVEDPNP